MYLSNSSSLSLSICSDSVMIDVLGPYSSSDGLYYLSKGSWTWVIISVSPFLHIFTLMRVFALSRSRLGWPKCSALYFGVFFMFVCYSSTNAFVTSGINMLSLGIYSMGISILCLLLQPRTTSNPFSII